MMTHQMNILLYQMIDGSNPTCTIFYWAIKDSCRESTTWCANDWMVLFCCSPHRFIEGKKEHWYPNPMIVIKDVVDMNKLQFAVWPQHRMNHQNMGERWVRRACLVEEMIKIFRELDIEFRMLPVDVNLRTIPESISSRLPSTWTTCVWLCTNSKQLIIYRISDTFSANSV